MIAILGQNGLNVVIKIDHIRNFGRRKNRREERDENGEKALHLRKQATPYLTNFIQKSTF